MKGLNDLNFYI